MSYPSQTSAEILDASAVASSRKQPESDLVAASASEERGYFRNLIIKKIGNGFGTFSASGHSKLGDT
jgi:hypothetical protein